MTDSSASEAESSDMELHSSEESVESECLERPINVDEYIKQMKDKSPVKEDDENADIIKDTAVNVNTMQDVFKNCDTYDEVLEQLDIMDQIRPKEPKHTYKGKHGTQKQCFFYLATFYPMIFSMIYFIFLILLLT